MMQRIRGAFLVLALATMSVLAGCGGGGGAGAQGDSSGVSMPAAIDLIASSPTIGSDGRSAVTITALVKDASSRAMSGQSVDFATSDLAGAVLQSVISRTDASGAASASLRISDPANRRIQVLARAGGLEKSISLEVVGTAITVNGPSSLIAGTPTEFSITLRDAAGQSLVGRVVSVSSQAGNGLDVTSVVTNTAGQARVIVTGTRLGADTLSVTALGASASASLSVSGTQMAFQSPGSGEEIPVAEARAVTVVYTVDGLPRADQAIQFATTRGTVLPSTAITDASGRARAVLRSDSAGAATLTAYADGVLGTRKIEFVSKVPARLTLQPNPATVAVNPGVNGGNSSQLIAVVRDAADNPVKGQVIAFSAIADPSNGRIEPSVATTDSAGVATVAFFPGANSSGPGLITLKAEVIAPRPTVSVSGTARLTASRQEFMVRVGTGNMLEEVDLATNAMPWTAVVTDAAGNPVEGVFVQAALIASGYYKGLYVLEAFGAQLRWVQRVSGYCISEDLNDGAGSGNLRLDPGEDTNGDGALTPGEVGSVRMVPADGRTDANGLVRLKVYYPKDYGSWTELRLRVTISAVAGTESTSDRIFTLPVIATDLDASRTPPGRYSPFGIESGCDSPY